MKHLASIIVTLCLLSSISAAGSADDSLDEKRRFLLTGMRAERDKLRSGQVIITGEHWGKTTRTLGMMRLPVRFDVYFDHDLRSYRYTQQDYEPEFGIKAITWADWERNSSSKQQAGRYGESGARIRD